MEVEAGSANTAVKKYLSGLSFEEAKKHVGTKVSVTKKSSGDIKIVEVIKVRKRRQGSKNPYDIKVKILSTKRAKRKRVQTTKKKSAIPEKSKKVRSVSSTLIRIKPKAPLEKTTDLNNPLARQKRKLDEGYYSKVPKRVPDTKELLRIRNIPPTTSIPVNVVPASSTALPDIQRKEEILREVERRNIKLLNQVEKFGTEADPATLNKMVKLIVGDGKTDELLDKILIAQRDVNRRGLLNIDPIKSMAEAKLRRALQLEKQIVSAYFKQVGLNYPEKLEKVKSQISNSDSKQEMKQEINNSVSVNTSGSDDNGEDAGDNGEDAGGNNNKSTGREHLSRGAKKNTDYSNDGRGSK